MMHGQKKHQIRHVCLFFRPSAWNSSDPIGRILIKLDIWVFLEKLS